MLVNALCAAASSTPTSLAAALARRHQIGGAGLDVLPQRAARSADDPLLTRAERRAHASPTTAAWYSETALVTLRPPARRALRRVAPTSTASRCDDRQRARPRGAGGAVSGIFDLAGGSPWSAGWAAGSAPRSAGLASFGADVALLDVEPDTLARLGGWRRGAGAPRALLEGDASDEEFVAAAFARIGRALRAGGHPRQSRLHAALRQARGAHARSGSARSESTSRATSAAAKPAGG